uniref:Uncharacterized protein n=1 Tax=Erpetoichthys calabaricus TaxID=27687 RepID=A0A8C4THS7_ERPCA
MESKYLMSSETKLTMLEMKLSLITTCLIFFQSLVSSPSNRQIDSKASFTTAGGLPMARTSTRCCFLIELTATRRVKRDGMAFKTKHAREVWGCNHRRGQRRKPEANTTGISSLLMQLCSPTLP